MDLQRPLPGAERRPNVHMPGIKNHLTGSLGLVRVDGLRQRVVAVARRRRPRGE